ncbi:S26 family signal peptidase [Mycoplasma sp. 480]
MHNLEIHLKENQYFVLGKNVLSSIDSKNFGYVLYSQIIAKVIS